MSTCNFSLRYNSDYLYAFCESSDFDAYLEDYLKENEISEDELSDSQRDDLHYWWQHDMKDFYLERLEEELYKLTPEGSGYYTDFTESGRICDGDEVAEVRKYIQFAGAEFMVMASVDFEAGYYEGFALDWNIKSIEGTSGGYGYDYLPDCEDCEYLLEENTNLNTGLRRALAPKLQARLEAALNDVTNIIEQALKVVSPYHLTGFCLDNGEGIYTNHKKSA